MLLFRTGLKQREISRVLALAPGPFLVAKNVQQTDKLPPRPGVSPITRKIMQRLGICSINMRGEEVFNSPFHGRALRSASL